MKCYIFDIDGTMADLTHRRHYIEQSPKNWPEFKARCYDDAPISHICDLARMLYWSAREGCQTDYDLEYDVVLVSGRNECQRHLTELWLYEVALLPPMKLYMRADGDYRDDGIVKSELLQKLLADGYKPIMAFDDRDRVVNMWRQHGIPCAQVAPGDF
jgi:FMN phosphatase YigB (HAD superfamily)